MAEKTKNQIAAESYNILHDGCTFERATKLLELSKPQLLAQKVYSVEGNEFSAAEYAMHLVFDATLLSGVDIKESHYIVAILLALQNCSPNNMLSFGSQLLYDLEKSGIRLTRCEKMAFLAQEGTFASNPYKKKLMRYRDNDCPSLGVILYAADLYARCGSLEKKHSLCPNDIPTELNQKFHLGWDSGNAQAALEAMMTNIVLPVTSRNDAERIKSFLKFLRTTDFYSCPARAHDFDEPNTTLAQHTWCVISRLASILRPQTQQELAKIILTGLCHDLCNAMGAIKRKMVEQRIYSTNGSYQEPDGRHYNVEWREICVEDDPVPYGHGRKSAHIATTQLGCNLISQDMLEAIDSHMRENRDSNYMYDFLYCQNKLALVLHIADMLATYADE